MSKLERDIIAERGKGGLRKARAMASDWEDLRVRLTLIKIVEYKKQGKSIREIAKEMGIHRSKVERTLQLSDLETSETCTL
jgi:DNA invertase Pin-like site-specific DNA recombinase